MPFVNLQEYARQHGFSSAQWNEVDFVRSTFDPLDPVKQGSEPYELTVWCQVDSGRYELGIRVDVANKDALGQLMADADWIKVEQLLGRVLDSGDVAVKVDAETAADFKDWQISSDPPVLRHFTRFPR